MAMLRIFLLHWPALRPIDLDRRRRFKGLRGVFDQFELIVEEIEHVVDAGRGARALIKNDRSIHDLAAMVSEIAALDDAEPKVAAHFTSVVGVANEMGHPRKVHRVFEIANARAYSNCARTTITLAVEKFGGFAEVDAQLIEGTVRSREIFVNQMGATNILAVDAILPVAEDVIGRMPEFVLIRSAKPGEPPVHHLGAAPRHASQ